MNTFIRRSFTTAFKNSKVPVLNFSKHNMQYIDKMEIIIYNESTVSKASLFRQYMYTSQIHFKKNNLYLYKIFEDDDFDALLNSINNFISTEIKI
jgi:hypothetical protein